MCSSPHGFADTDMPTMCQQLQREEENLCAQRGLVQGQDVQTFTMRLDKNFAEKFKKIRKSAQPNSSQVRVNLIIAFPYQKHINIPKLVISLELDTEFKVHRHQPVFDIVLGSRKTLNSNIIEESYDV